MVKIIKTAGIILAGGKSLRLGREKILEHVNGKALIERVLSSIRLICDEIVVVTSDEKYSDISKAIPDFLTVKDIIPGKAALGAIYTGLVNTTTDFSLIVAGDMPFGGVVGEVGDFIPG